MSQIKALIKRQPEESVASHVCNVQRDHYYPKRMDSVSMMKFRAQLFKNQLRKLHSKMEEEEWTHQRVLIVSHRTFGRAFGTKDLDNCEMTTVDDLLA